MSPKQKTTEIICLYYKDEKAKDLDREDNPYPAVIKELKEKHNLYARASLLDIATPVVYLKGDLSSIDQGLDYLIEQLGWPNGFEKPTGFIGFFETERTTKEAYKLFKEKCEENQKKIYRNIGRDFALLA